LGLPRIAGSTSGCTALTSLFLFAILFIKAGIPSVNAFAPKVQLLQATASIFDLYYLKDRNQPL